MSNKKGVEALTQKESSEKTETVSQAQLSVILGLSTSRIRQLDKDNVFEKIGRGKYDLPKTVQKYINYLVDKATATDDDELDKLKEETLWTRARRQKAEVEYKIMTGHLHRAKDVEHVMNHMLASFRSQLLTFPTKVAPMVTGVTEVMVVKDVLKDEIHALMTELSDYDPDIFYGRSEDKIFVEEDGDSDGRTATKS